MPAILNNRTLDGRVDAGAMGYRLEKAAASCSNDDRAMGAECSCKAPSADSRNEETWAMLAEHAGWDSKMCTLDLDKATTAIRRALAADPEGGAALAAHVYHARKSQIGLMLEAHSMMPSYESAKHVHETMLAWLRLLEETSPLRCDIVKHEIALCDMMCARSRKSVVPADRLVYVAYASFNRKEGYGATFHRALDARIEEGHARKEALKKDARDRAMHRRISYQAWTDCEQPNLEARRERLIGDAARLQADIRSISGLADTGYYRQQIHELEQRFSVLKELNLMKKHRIKAQIDCLNGKIDRIENEFAPLLRTLREDAASTRRLVSEIDCALANE